MTVQELEQEAIQLLEPTLYLIRTEVKGSDRWMAEEGEPTNASESIVSLAKRFAVSQVERVNVETVGFDEGIRLGALHDFNKALLEKVREQKQAIIKELSK